LYLRRVTAPAGQQAGGDLGIGVSCERLDDGELQFLRRAWREEFVERVGNVGIGSGADEHEGVESLVEGEGIGGEKLEVAFEKVREKFEA